MMVGGHSNSFIALNLPTSARIDRFGPQPSSLFTSVLSGKHQKNIERLRTRYPCLTGVSHRFTVLAQTCLLKVVKAAFCQDTRSTRSAVGSGSRERQLRVLKGSSGQNVAIEYERNTLSCGLIVVASQIHQHVDRSSIWHDFPQQLKALVSAQIGSGVVQGGPEVRFHEGSVPPGFEEGSTRVPPGFH